jgi:hypothetical protein
LQVCDHFHLLPCSRLVTLKINLFLYVSNSFVLSLFQAQFFLSDIPSLFMKVLLVSYFTLFR